MILIAYIQDSMTHFRLEEQLYIHPTYPTHSNHPQYNTATSCTCFQTTTTSTKTTPTLKSSIFYILKANLLLHPSMPTRQKVCQKNIQLPRSGQGVGLKMKRLPAETSACCITGKPRQWQTYNYSKG